MKNKAIVISIFILVALGTATMLLWKYQTSSWQTYRDPDYAYQIRVPKQWAKYPFSPERGYVNFFSRPDIRAPLEMSQNDIMLTVFVRNANDNFPETFANRTLNNLEGVEGRPTSVLNNRTTLTIDSSLAIRQYEETGPNIDTEIAFNDVVYAIRSGKLFVFSFLATNQGALLRHKGNIEAILAKVDLP